MFTFIYKNKLIQKYPEKNKAANIKTIKWN